MEDFDRYLDGFGAEDDTSADHADASDDGTEDDYTAAATDEAAAAKDNDSTAAATDDGAKDVSTADPTGHPSKGHLYPYQGKN